MSQTLHSICSTAWETETWPHAWTQSVIICLFKKGDRNKCENYRTISLINHSSKVLLDILRQRLRPHVDRVLSQEQAGFRRGRSTLEQIFSLRHLAEKYLEVQDSRLVQAFIDYKKAFDRVWHEALFHVLDHYGIPPKIRNLISTLYNHAVSAVRQDDGVGEWFRTSVGSRQGCILSPDLFNLYIENIMSIALDRTEGIGVLVGGHLFNNLRFADDIALLASSADDLQELLNSVNETSTAFGMEISEPKTKVMCTARTHEDLTIQLNGQDLEQVTEFTYLDSSLSAKNISDIDINKRIAKASSVVGRLKDLWQDHQVSLQIIVKLLETLVFPILSYACESWTLKADSMRRIEAFEMQCFRRLLGISWRDHITNEEVIRRLGTTLNERLLQSIKRRQAVWFGHVSRMPPTRFPKMALFGLTPGRKCRGRPPKRWIQETLQHINLPLAVALQRAQDRNQWRAIVRGPNVR